MPRGCGGHNKTVPVYVSAHCTKRTNLVRVTSDSNRIRLSAPATTRETPTENLDNEDPVVLKAPFLSEPLRPPERQDPVGLRRTRAFEILVHAMKKRHRLTVADTWSCCSILELRAHGPKLHWRMKCWCRWNRRRCRPSRTILKFSS